MARLTETQKTFIVQSLACFQTPTDVCELVQEVFGLELTRGHVHYYDASAPASKTPKKWRAVFEATRKAWLESTAEVGIAHERYRLEELQRLYNRVKRSGNVPLAASLLEQGAKEKGGAFTNYRKLEHSGQVKTTGVMVLPAQAGSKEWSEVARAQQQALVEEAARATEAATRG